MLGSRTSGLYAENNNDARVDDNRCAEDDNDDQDKRPIRTQTF